MRGSLSVVAGRQQGTASCGVADLCYTDRCFVTLLLEIPKADLQNYRPASY